MTIRLSDLTPIQRYTIIGLDDESADSPGREVAELRDEIVIVCFDLQKLGLVEARNGWRGTCWFQLTSEGRRLREEPVQCRRD